MLLIYTLVKTGLKDCESFYFYPTKHYATNR